MTAGLMLSGLAACSSEEPALNGANGDFILKAPKVIAYSGSQILGNGGVFSRTANVNGNQWYQDWDCPANVTEEEIQKVLEAVKNPIYEQNTIKIDWENYWVQQVYKGVASYTDGAGNTGIVGSDKMNHLLAYNENASMDFWDSDLGDWGQQTQIHYEHINNFNNGNNQTVYTEDGNSPVNPGAQYFGTTLMTGMDSENVDAQHQFGYHNSVDSKNHFEYIIIEIDGNYYVCFDFYATHPKGQDANKNMDVERDWIFNDWIVKISPAYHVGETPDPTPGEDPDPTPGVDPDPETPETPVEVKHDNEVEINLHGVEKGEDPLNPEYYESHLSIHVRHATDVEVFIPIPANLYCPEDDMYIFETHLNGNGAYGGSQTEYTVTYPVAEYTVTLTVKLEEEGIRVTTDGINQDVIDYLFEKNGDGITFEVWNYFGDSGIDQYGVEHNHGAIDIETLINHLNKSTVKFLDSEPDYYINAFHYEYDGEGNKGEGINPHDCKVKIDDDQIDDYQEPYEAWHLNNAPYNQIYDRKDVKEHHSDKYQKDAVE